MTRAARILLVDDEMSIQRAVVPLLRSRGYEVETVATRCIREESPVPIIVLSARGGRRRRCRRRSLRRSDDRLRSAAGGSGRR